jgi:hypothetical protein
MAVFTLQQKWEVVREIEWSTKSKIVSPCPFTERVSQALVQMVIKSTHFKYLGTLLCHLLAYCLRQVYLIPFVSS